jgi:hypothetical protein
MTSIPDCRKAAAAVEITALAAGAGPPEKTMAMRLMPQGIAGIWGRLCI